MSMSGKTLRKRTRGCENVAPMPSTDEPSRKKARGCKTMPSLKFYDYTREYDRVLVAGRKNFYVNSKQLAAKFNYFQCLFEKDFIEKSRTTIHLEGISSRSLELFLIAAEDPKNFRITRSSLMELSVIASFFMAPELIMDIMSVKSNFAKFARVELLNIADECAFPELRNLAEDNFVAGLNDNRGERFYYFGIAVRYGLEKVTANILDWLMSCPDSSFYWFMGKVWTEAPQRIANRVLQSEEALVCKNYVRFTEKMSDTRFTLIRSDVESYIQKIFNDNGELFNKFCFAVECRHFRMMDSVKELIRQSSNEFNVLKLRLYA